LRIVASADRESALTQRAQEVLRLIVQEHVRSGEPVGSRHVAQLHPESISAATVRHLMGQLTQLGLLTQPHTSAGRVPTDAGYRYVVDEVLTRGRRLPKRDARRIESLLLSSGEIEHLLSRASRLLAEMTRQVGVALAPDLEHTVLEHVEFVRIASHRVVAIFVSSSGLVTHRVIDSDEELSQEELDALSSRLRGQLSGRTLPEVRSRMLAALREDHRTARKLGQLALDSVAAFLEPPYAVHTTELFVEGTSSLLDAPEFSDVDRLREVLRAIEERTKLLRLLDDCLLSQGVQVLIGSETRDPDLAPMSLVTSSYTTGSERGLVGIVGPRRMEYARAVALVDHFARTISRALTAEERPGREEGR
jgi:heat-inducible transcriptional repressor